MPAISITLAATLLLLAAGVWVGVGLGLSGIIGLTQVLGWERAVDIVGKIVWEQNTSFILVAIPMFIFMGEILFQSGVMSTIYLRAATAVSGIPGGLLQANIAACTIFAACSGSSVASAGRSEAGTASPTGVSLPCDSSAVTPSPIRRSPRASLPSRRRTPLRRGR